LRLSREAEMEGIDIFLHGTPAYHMEFGQGMTYSAMGTSSPPGGGVPTGDRVS